MELKHKLEKIFNDDYPGTERFIADVIEPIFGNEIENIDEDLAEREMYAEKAKKAGIKHIIYIGDLTEKNYNADNIALLDVTLDDSKNIERSRVNIQQLIRSIMDYRQHLMIVFHYEDVKDKQWRFSYAYKGFFKGYNFSQTLYICFRQRLPWSYRSRAISSPCQKSTK